MGMDHDDVLQRAGAATVLVQKNPFKPLDRFHHVNFGERRHVVRALRHHRDLVASRFSAGQLGLLQADVGGHLHVYRNFRIVLHDVFVVHSISADDRHFRSQRRDAAG
jgi:hypothetical protein